MITHLLFYTLLILVLGVVFFSFSGVLVYDFKMARLHNQLIKHPYLRRFRKRPNIAILVLVNENNIDYLERCLTSIAKNNYRKYEIIVAAEYNSYQIRKIVSKFKKRYKSASIKTQAIRSGSWQAAANKNSKTEYLAVVDAACELQNDALKQSVSYMALKPSVNIIVPYSSSPFDYTIKGLLNQYGQLVQNQWQKPMSLMGLLKVKSNKFVFYRSPFVLQDSSLDYYSATSVIVPQQNPIILNIQRKKLFAVLYLGAFLIASYFILLAFSSHYRALLALLWVGAAFYIVLNVWSDEHLAFFTKLKMSLLSPMICVLFYLILPIKIIKLTSLQSARKQPSVQFVG